MDGYGIDAVAKALAAGTTRRAVVKRLGLGGVAAAILGVGGGRRVLAQEATPAAEEATVGGLCLIPFEMAVREGPSQGTKLSGVLAATTDADGKIDATFIGGGRSYPVTGQADGRAVTLVFDLGQDGVVYGVGGGDADFASCSMKHLGGPLVGPSAGDAGDWAIIKRRIDDFPPICFAGDPNCPPAPTEPVQDPIPGDDACPVEGDVQSCISMCTGNGVGPGTCNANCRAAFLC